MNLKVIIPAREGSKGLPGKNLKLLNGKPLIDYSIETSLKLFDEESIILTSDSKDIIERGLKHGVRIINRPKEIARDDSKIIDTILHAVDFTKELYGENIEDIILLQPTFPIRDHLEIKNAVNYFYKEDLDSLVSVINMKEHPCECISLSQKKHEWSFLIDPNKVTNRQLYPGEYFFINGNFYISKIEFLKKNKSFFSRNTNFFKCKSKYSIDIDDIDDFEYAEYCMLKLENVSE